MNGLYTKLLVLLATASVVSCYCPIKWIHSIGDCSFQMQCIGTIRNTSLPTECRGATNYDVHVDLTLIDAIERFDTHIKDTEFLTAVTTFRAVAAWPETGLTFLEYMPRLRNLILMGDKIERITGEPFYHLNQLEHLDLSRNRLSDIEDLFQFESDPNKLRFLSLANNALQEIPGDAFAELTSLIELDLSSNYIMDLNEEPFSNLTNLETLRLNNNRIKDLNGAVNNLINLKHLFLRGNQIQNIDEESLKVIYHLETFDVSGNQLDRLKPIVFSRHWKHFNGICKIILSENQITSVPNGTSKEQMARFTRDLMRNEVDVLTELDLSKNEISNVEFNAFQSIVGLISLDLSSNNLTNFVVSAKDLSDLKRLNLSCNYITNLYYDTFSLMRHLQNIDLSHNRLNYIADETFVKNYNLRFVNMTFNAIQRLDHIRIKMFNPAGGMLDLSNNDLSQLDIPIGEGLHLTVLILTSNKICDSSSINLLYQVNLHTLIMNNNEISKLNDSSLLLPSSVLSLDLSYNKIQEVGPSSFKRVRNLNTLNLSHNRLTNLEFGSFQGLMMLSRLDLSNNQIKYLNSKVLMDLKLLRELFMGYNGLTNLDYNQWLSHRVPLKVYLEGNNYSCQWLARALRDYNNGYSTMRPVVHQYVQTAKHTIEGIPCEQKSQDIIEGTDLFATTVTDERLLSTNQKILEAVREQTYYLKVFLNQFNVNASYYKSVWRV